MHFPSRQTANYCALHMLNSALGTGYKMSLDDFEIIRWIGIGGFSTVIEVKKKDTGKTYAMKIIQKWMIEKKAKIKQIMAERNILKMVDNPFIIKLHWAFKSVSKFWLRFRNEPNIEL